TSPDLRQLMALRYAPNPMNIRSGVTSIVALYFSLRESCCVLIRSSNTSAIATSFTGPAAVERPLTSAPHPRPPQPVNARRIVLSSAAKTFGMLTPANDDAAAIAEPFLRNSRRLVLG